MTHRRKSWEKDDLLALLPHVMKEGTCVSEKDQLQDKADKVKELKVAKKRWPPLGFSTDPLSLYKQSKYY